jgi:hypothetical protein
MFLGGIEENKLYLAPEIWGNKLPLTKFRPQFCGMGSKIGIYGLISPPILWYGQ